MASQYGSSASLTVIPPVAALKIDNIPTVGVLVEKEVTLASGASLEPEHDFQPHTQR